MQQCLAGDFKTAPYRPIADLPARHAKRLSDDANVVARIRAQQVDIDHLFQDWHLNELTMP